MKDELLKISGVVASGVASGLKPPTQFMEALRADARESASADFHALRQGFIPTVMVNLRPQSTNFSRITNHATRRPFILYPSSLILSL